VFVLVAFSLISIFMCACLVFFLVVCRVCALSTCRNHFTLKRKTMDSLKVLRHDLRPFMCDSSYAILLKMVHFVRMLQRTVAQVQKATAAPIRTSSKTQFTSGDASEGFRATFRFRYYSYSCLYKYNLQISMVLHSMLSIFNLVSVT
jgi:hypothetical protein